MTRHWQETWFVTLLILAEAPHMWNVNTKNLHEDVCLLHLHDTDFSFSLLILLLPIPSPNFMVSGSFQTRFLLVWLLLELFIQSNYPLPYHTPFHFSLVSVKGIISNSDCNHRRQNQLPKIAVSEIPKIIMVQGLTFCLH